jgi:hypothetical protein
MQLAISVALLVVGVIFALLMDIPNDFRFFGWLLIGCGVFGLLTRWYIARQRAGPDRPTKP